MEPKRSVCFTVPDFVVIPKQSDRTRIVKCKDGSEFIQHYQPADVTNNAFELAGKIRRYRPSAPLTGPVLAFYSIGLPFRKTERKAVRTQGWGLKSTKPDYDNFCKQIGDVLEEACFLNNDSQIAAAFIVKTVQERPTLGIGLYELSETDGIPEILRHLT